MTLSLQSYDTLICPQSRTSQQTNLLCRPLCDGTSGKYDSLWATNRHKSNATKAVAGDEAFPCIPADCSGEKQQPSQHLGVDVTGIRISATSE